MAATETAARAGREYVDPATGEIVALPPAPRAPAAPSALTLVEIQRAVAEEQATRAAARAMPREPLRCRELVLQACQDPTLAEHAVYQYARGGSDISGASIRLLEAIARCWGNVDAGIREIARHDGYSDCEAFAIDLESGFRDRRAFPVRHWRDTKKGGYALTDERDIYETVANAGQRRKRACLESVIPSNLVAAAVEECERTMKARADTSPEAMNKMLEAFAEFGVTRAQIEQRLQRRLEAIAPAQVVGLKRIYRSLRDGMSIALDWFESAAPAAPASLAPGPSGDGTPTSADSPAGAPGRRKKVSAGGTSTQAQKTPADATPAPPPAESELGPFAPRPIADYGREIEHAADAEVAALVLDEARTAGVGQDDLDALTATWRARWDAGDAQ